MTAHLVTADQSAAIAGVIVAAQTAAKQSDMEVIVTNLNAAGNAIGKYVKSQEKARGALTAAVSGFLSEAMTAGLTVDMLKAPSKAAPQACYVAIVSSMEKARGTELSAAVRDNYMSKIRAFVKDRGANALDLFGNLANAAKAKAARSPQTPSGVTAVVDAEKLTEQNSGSPANKAVQRGVEEKLIGVIPLHQFLGAWLTANPVGSVAGDYRDQAVELHAALSAVLKK